MPTRNGKSKVGTPLPAITEKDSQAIVDMLQGRLVALTDLALTLKHIHWNVVGPTFIGVHEMLDPQHAGVLEMIDDTAERISALGGSPIGTPGALVAARGWDDYDLRRATAIAHLGALDLVYQGVIASHRQVMESLDSLDMVSQDMIIGQLHDLEKYLWFVRAHLESADGIRITEGETTEAGAARKARAKASLGDG
ncbi:MAG: DNA starvation/stationary phase protection protein [Thermoleophilia bacterium]